MKPEMDQILAERFGKDTVMALATAANGKPSVRYIDVFYENGAFYTITYALSGKMKQIEANPAVALAGEWFTAHGTGVSLGWFGKAENQEIAGKLSAAFAEWIDNGHNNFEDRNTIILRIDLTDGLLLSHGTRYEF